MLKTRYTQKETGNAQHGQGRKIDGGTSGLRHVLPHFRVGGFISKLQEVLNLDGYEVVRYDPAARQVHLDREKLAQLFEVKL